MKIIPFTAPHTYISHIGLYKTPNKALSCLVYMAVPSPPDIPLVLFDLLVVLTFELVDQTLRRNHSNEPLCSTLACSL